MISAECLDSVFEICGMSISYLFVAESDAGSAIVEDVITLVKGGILDSSSGVLLIRTPETYRSWGAGLKYNPTLIDYEASSAFTSQT